MSLSYSALTNHGKITLPSAESWGSNMNILKDPPKSLYTRRIDKVGQTSDITASIDEGTDRACETIRQFARGVNPSVSVQYNNTNNMSGNRNTNGGQAFLPYRVARDGAFRPPIQTQQSLLPLSRQPRIWTKSFTNPAFVDFSKKAIVQATAEKTKEVKNNLLNVSVRPTAVYKIATPLEKPYEVKYVIQPSLNKSVQSNIKTTDQTHQHVIEPTTGINKNANHAFAQSNINDIKYVNHNRVDTDRYIQDTNAHSVNTIKGSNYIQIGSLDDFVDMGNIKTQEIINVNYKTQLKGNEKTNYIHDDLYQQRNLPYYSATSAMKGDKNEVTYLHDDIQLDRNLPQHVAVSNIRGDKNEVTYLHDDIQLDRNLPQHVAVSNMRGDKNEVTYLHDELSLNKTLPNYSATSGLRGDKNNVAYIHGDIELSRAIPFHSASSNINGDKKISYIHDDLQLYRNIPEYHVDSTMRGNDKVEYIHDDIELERVLPNYQMNTGKTRQNLQKDIKPEHVKEMYGSLPTVKDVYLNKGGNGESNVSSRNYHLADKIQPGGYQIPGQVPNQNRATNIKENFESDKAKMNKKVMDQHLNRFGSVYPQGPK
jgi:hypothetical protein